MWQVVAMVVAAAMVAVAMETVAVAPNTVANVPQRVAGVRFHSQLVVKLDYWT